LKPHWKKRTEGRLKNRWRYEVIDDLEKQELRNWIQLAKEKIENDLVQNTKTHIRVYNQK
jgi:hypothetical protein